jgi:hypothetical protein
VLTSLASGIAYLSLAGLLFYLVNRIGEFAVDFGYGSTTLFSEPNESLALNFFIRALAPTVFIIILSAAAVAAGEPDLRLGTFWIVVIYYSLRAAYIFTFNLHRLVSWPRFLVHAGVGLIAAALAYKHLIIPQRSLLPDLEEAGNEIWLAIGAFLYAVANNARTSGDPGTRRRNSFVARSYRNARSNFGEQIERITADPAVKLIAYAVLVYESYCRPPAVRFAERFAFWKEKRTTGIMQVAADQHLTDSESVQLGTEKLLAAWNANADEQHGRSRAWSVLTDYNYDSDYASNVIEIMELIAKRADQTYRPVWEDLESWPEDTDSSE